MAEPTHDIKTTSLTGVPENVIGKRSPAIEMIIPAGDGGPAIKMDLNQAEGDTLPSDPLTKRIIKTLHNLARALGDPDEE